MNLFQDFYFFIQSLGWVGGFVFVVAYALIVMVFLPVTPFSVASGALFGWWGVPLSILGAWLGAMASFFVARYIGYDFVCRQCEKHKSMKAVDRAIESSGWWGVLLIRLSGLLPYAVQNYGLGVTGVKKRDYAFGSFFGLFPGSMAKVWIGVTAGDIFTSDLPMSPKNWAFIAMAVLATLLLLVYMTRLTKKEFERLS